MAAFESTKPRVLIIGAGPSGIGAARTLFQAGFDPIILEARDRIGGRMWAQKLTPNLINQMRNLSESEELLTTSASEFYDDSCEESETVEVTIQLGANWIHGLNAEFNPMYVRANLLKLGLYQTTPDSEPGHDVILFDSGLDCQTAMESQHKAGNAVGTPVDWQKEKSFPQVTMCDYQKVLDRYYWIRERLDLFENRNGGILTLKQAFEYAIISSENEEEQFGPCTEQHRRCLNWIFDRITIEWARDSLDSIPVSIYQSIPTDGEYGEALVSGGFFQILEDLACEFPLTILLEHVVTTVTMRDAENDIVVECANGQIFVVDYCIVTLPVGVLNANCVKFYPRVPPCITNITSVVHVGLMNLVWMLFPSFFWPQNVNFFGIARDAAQRVNFSTFLAPPMCDQFGCRQPILMCQVIGPLAHEIENMSDVDIAKRAMVVIRSMFGNDVPFPIGLRHSSWKSEPFARGSWCSLAKINTCKQGCFAESLAPDGSLLSSNSVLVPDGGAFEDGDTCSVGSRAVSTESTDIEEVNTPNCRMNHETLQDINVRRLVSESALTDASEADCTDCTDCTSPSPKPAPSPPKLPQTNDQKRLFSKLESNMFYAGEAAHELYRGTVHGAFLSGVREADKLLERISFSSPTATRS